MDTMDITALTEADFPMFYIAVNRNRFTNLPFKTKEMAQNHINKHSELANRNLLGKVEIKEYTTEFWRQDLIDSLYSNEAAIRELVHTTTTETIAKALHKHP